MDSRGKQTAYTPQAAAITKHDIRWFELSTDKTPEAFFKNFRIFMKAEGYIRYARVLHQANLCEQERKFLFANFDAWKRSEGMVFWKRWNAIVVEKSVWSTAGNLVDGSEPLAAALISDVSKECRQHIKNSNISGQPDLERDTETSADEECPVGATAQVALSSPSSAASSKTSCPFSQRVSSTGTLASPSVRSSPAHEN
ncbi:hypothetical protein BGW42_006997 [Actinomortierella wolfii]|nr:hypothetical protein BGW42_006997 [Actinomortierella wolfii]